MVGFTSATIANADCGAVCGIGAHIEEVTEDHYFCYYCGAKMDEEDARE